MKGQMSLCFFLAVDTYALKVLSLRVEHAQSLMTTLEEVTVERDINYDL